MLKFLVTHSFRNCNGTKSLLLSRNYVRKAPQPGIDRRLKLFSDDIVDDEDPDLFEDLEADFMNVHHAHKQFEKEEKQHKIKVNTWIVGQKYFREKGLNFLTWSEKEQIRILHEKNPKEWNPDTLSKSFPADPFTISKIIKNKWLPKDERQVQKHDESVKKSWEKFNAGELEVEPILADHLKKFVDRNFEELAKPKFNRKLGVEIPKPSSTEFLNIITSCKKYSEENKRSDEKDIEQSEVLKLEEEKLIFPKFRPSDPEQDSILLKSKTRKTLEPLTLQEYEKYSPDITLQRELNINKKTESSTSITSEILTDLHASKHRQVDVSTLNSDDSKVFKSLEIKEYIEIPKELWKENQIYKVGDCFYTDDGEFLYRVPGLK